MAKQKRIDQIKNLLRSYRSNGSIKATARQLKVSRNTVREYIRRAEAYSLKPSSWLATSVKSATICVLLNCIGSSFLVVFSDH
jgi:DNA invertase Pin-like site-specific DNA recombinase